MTEPALQTERLVLRAPERSDFEEFAAMRADPVVARYTSGAPASADDTWQRLLRYRGLWGIAGFGYWVARERATGRFVGTIGFGDFRRGLTPSLEDIPEAGWGIGLMVSRSGLCDGRRACGAALARHHDGPYTFCLHHRSRQRCITPDRREERVCVPDRHHVHGERDTDVRTSPLNGALAPGAVLCYGTIQASRVGSGPGTNLLPGKVCASHCEGMWPDRQSRDTPRIHPCSRRNA